MIWIIAAAGWVLAAFLTGLLVGRARDGPTRKKPNTGNQEPASAIDKQAAEKLRREWANFLTYDGHRTGADGINALTMGGRRLNHGRKRNYAAG